MYSFQQQQKPHLTKAGIRAQQYQTQGCFEIKAMKRPACKRPAAQEEKEEEEEAQESEEGIPSVELTAAAVKDHNKFCEEAKGMTVGQFELALAKMDAKASMRLWKAFEVQRKSAGEEEGYQSATSKGTGSLKKKRQLLFGWIKDGGKTGEHYRTWMDTVSLKKSKGLTETWLTTHQALAHWGPEELKERVKTGSIVTRKDPSDKNFWQFRALTETAKTEVERVKTTGVSSKSKAKVEALQALGQLEGLEALTEEDFVPGVESGSEDVEEDGELPAGLAKALGEKVKKEKKEKKEKEEEDKWETMSQVKEGEGSKELQNRLVAFKTELTKDTANLEALLHTGKGSLAKSLQKDAEKVVQEGQAVVKEIGEAIGSAKKADVAALLQKALAALKQLKTKKLQLRKAVRA